MNSLKAQILTVLIVLSQGLQSHSSSLESFASHVIDDLAKLPLDRNGRLDDNWFLYQDTPSCENAFKAAWLRERPDFRQIAPCTSNITEIFFGPAKSICSAVAFVKGTKPDLLTHVLPTHQLIATDIDTVEDVTAWVQGHQTVEAGFLSHEAADMKLIWINPTNSERVNSGTLKFGEVNTIWTGTRLGHKFELVDDVSNELIATYTIQHDSFFVVGEIDSRIHDRDVSTQVENIFNGEWERSKKIKRTFTELGFSLGKLPLDLWGSISAYYYNNRNSKADEEWNSKGIFVNWWESDVYLIGMPWKLKKSWQSRLKILVEEWSGVELELTDIYGMRRYEDGARLLSHVDREATHAASLIINVAQGGMREPWTVEIYDFADRLHEITMEEGDVVYYESARCLHGRMRPLQGAFYVNFFAHYRPIGDPDWYKKENPEDAVPHLIDIGDCTLVEGKPNCTNGNGRVPFLSPTLETLKGPNDLMRYWKDTAPTVAHVGGNEEL